MKHHFTPLALLLIATVQSLPATAQKINVLTYNIRFASFNENVENWDNRKQGVIELLKGNDFIGLQEVVPVQMDDIARSLGSDYGYLYRTREADSTKGEGCPVLYNKKRWDLIAGGHFWLSGTPELPGSSTWGNAYIRLSSFGLFRERNAGDSVLVINTHLDNESQNAREKSINLILEKFDNYLNYLPVVFMGDFNLNPENPVYNTILSSAGLKDSWATAHHSTKDPGATFHGWTGNIPTERIDFIFVSSDLMVKSGKVIRKKYNGNFPSDHFPLKSVLKLDN